MGRKLKETGYSQRLHSQAPWGMWGTGAELYLSSLSGLMNAFHTPTSASLTQH